MPRDYKSFPRVYVSADLAADTPVMLDADQSNHLVNVLRLKEGDGAILFNGRDGAWLGKITKAGKKGAALDLSVQTAHQTPPSDLWFGIARSRSAASTMSCSRRPRWAPAPSSR